MKKGDVVMSFSSLNFSSQHLLSVEVKLLKSWQAFSLVLEKLEKSKAFTAGLFARVHSL
mgnify:FL=1